MGRETAAPALPETGVRPNVHGGRCPGQEERALTANISSTKRNNNRASETNVPSGGDTTEQGPAVTGRPSLVASARLADAIGREVADLRVRLEEASLRSDAYREAGQTRAAAQVVDEQRALVAGFADRLGSVLAGAAVEREAEDVLAGTGDLARLGHPQSDANAPHGDAAQGRTTVADAPAAPQEPAPAPSRARRLPVVASALATAAAVVAFVLAAPPSPPPQTLAAAGSDQPDAPGADGAPLGGSSSSGRTEITAAQTDTPAEGAPAGATGNEEAAAAPTAPRTRDVTDALVDLQDLVGHLASGLPAQVLHLLAADPGTDPAPSLPLPATDTGDDAPSWQPDGTSAAGTDTDGAPAETEATGADATSSQDEAGTTPDGTTDPAADGGDRAGEQDPTVGHAGTDNPWQRSSSSEDSWLLPEDGSGQTSGW